MSLILKSNSVATRSMGNIYELRGPTDFSAMLDFEKEIYSVRGESLSLSDVLLFSRPSKASYRAISGEIMTADAGVPRFHSIEGTGRYGLLLEPEVTNLLSNPLSPSTQTVVGELSARGWSYFSLKVEGSGSATLTSSEPIENQTPSLVATESNTVVVGFPPGVGETNLMVSVSGNLSYFELTSLQSSGWGTLDGARLPFGVSTRAKDVASLSSRVMDGLTSSEAGTFLVAVSRNRELIPGSSASSPWVTLKSSQNTYGGIYLRSTRRNTLSVSGRADQSSASPDLFTYSQPMADVSSITMGFSWSGNGTDTLLANNGIVSQENSAGGIPNMDQFIMTGPVPGQSGVMNAVITHVVFYPRALSAQELQEATLSWL